jgi:hypothetical protein
VGALRELRGTLTVFGAAPTSVTLTVVAPTPAGRIGRALGVLAACWIAALIAVFIPVAHFVLVPGLAITGVVWATRELRRRVRVLKAVGECPRCRRQQSFVPAGSAGDQLAFDCPACLTRLLATPEASPAVPAR